MSSTQSGATERDHLEQVYKQTGVKPKELENEHNFPSILSHVWSAFVHISNGRSAGFSGPNPIQYSEIKAWCELTGTPLSSWHVEIIKLLDSKYIGALNG